MTINCFCGATENSRYHRLSPFESKAVSAAMVHDGFRGAGRGALFRTPILPQHDTIGAARVLSNFVADSQFEDSINEAHYAKVDTFENRTPSGAAPSNVMKLSAPTATAAIAEKQNKKTKKSPGTKRRIGSCGDTRIYIDQVKDEDILCGRGGRSNHHLGNKKYRQVVNEMKMKYKGTEGKLAKTDLSKTIVEYVSNYGGRFIKKDEQNGKYYLLTPKEARRKTSQALREAKNCKWMAE